MRSLVMEPVPEQTTCIGISVWCPFAKIEGEGPRQSLRTSRNVLQLRTWFRKRLSGYSPAQLQTRRRTNEIWSTVDGPRSPIDSQSAQAKVRAFGSSDEVGTTVRTALLVPIVIVTRPGSNRTNPQIGRAHPLAPITTEGIRFYTHLFRVRDLSPHRICVVGTSSTARNEAHQQLPALLHPS